ncbi:condensin complex subunit 3-like [Drosophila miranda]|uniref:condensin complex subunit 3-like n=1 Tax=Drosophila miranda TaxID=7229 RepID=UPI00143F4659|nr:condensin complex subunit 3-like [Drosophila miranda]
MAQLPLGDDCELHRCVPLECLNVKLLLYWQCLGDYLESTQADESDQVLPELSVFCTYVNKFCESQKPDMDKFAQIEFQNMLLSLVEILDSYDLGDEIGRSNMKTLIKNLLKDCLLDHKIVRVLVRCMEKLITDLNDRMKFFIEIIYETCDLNTKQNELVHDRNLISTLLDDLDTPSKMKISSLKVKIGGSWSRYWGYKEENRISYMY